MVYYFWGGLNQATSICKKKLFRLWISCVYLWANLWFAAFIPKCAAAACQPSKGTTI